MLESKSATLVYIPCYSFSAGIRPVTLAEWEVRRNRVREQVRPSGCGEVDTTIAVNALKGIHLGRPRHWRLQDVKVLV